MSQVLKVAQRVLSPGFTHEEAALYACESIRMTVKGSTWAVYRSLHLKSIDDENERILVAEIYRKHGLNKQGERRERKPSKRKKGVSQGDFDTLLSELGSDSYARWGKATKGWIITIRETGIRPAEAIGGAVVTVSGELCLRVKNLKIMKIYSSKSRAEEEGRNHHLYRNIPIGHVDREHIEVIKKVCQILTNAHIKGQYGVLYDRIRKTLDRAARAAFPNDEKRPTLYSMRHAYRDQLEQRLLDQGCTPFQSGILISAAMGHGSEKTKYAYGTGDDVDLAPAKQKVALSNLTEQAKEFLGKVIDPVQ